MNLIPQDRADGFLSDSLYRKLQDSFCGVDTFGNKVPDPNLGPAERYGVQFRPRQSMFIDRFGALKNYLIRTNTVLAQYPISETRSFTLLNSSEPIPVESETINAGSFIVGDTYTIFTVGTTDFTLIGATSNTVGVAFTATGAGTGTGTAVITNWNLQVANLEQLGFQTPIWSNTSGPIPLGYKYLVTTDSSNRGLWTIYTVSNSDTMANTRVLILTKIQGFNTPDYWSYINWYRPGYNSSTKVVAEVPTYSALSHNHCGCGQ
jgi:hypothetical protein